MFKKADDNDYMISETGNWNVASDYSKLKIMKNLYLADEYATISAFGYSDLIEEIGDYGDVDTLRIRGFRRLIHVLKMVINNSLFAVKKERDVFKSYENELKRIENLIPLLYSIKTDQIKKRTKLQIKEERFNKLLDRVLEIKSNINEPLNKNDLIFTNKEEFDPKAYKKAIFEEATTKG